MPNSLLPKAMLLVCFLLPQLAFSQITNIFISGPEAVCQYDCAIYQVFYDSNPNTPPADIKWEIIYPNGITQAFDSLDVIEICFDTPGTVLIIATVDTQNGQVNTAEYLVIVFPADPVFIQSLNPNTCDSLIAGGTSGCEKVCPYSTITYQATTSAGPGGSSANIIWTVFGEESYTIDPVNNQITITWGDSGPGSITAFSGNSNCIDETVHCVTIVEEPIADIGATPSGSTGDTIRICKGQTVYFDNLSQYADEYEWTFGDGSAPVNNIELAHDYLNPGLYEVSLVARSNCACSDTARIWVEVLDAEAPLPDCIGTVCPGATITYTTNANCTDFSWNVSPNGTILAGGGLSDNNITISWGDGPIGEISLFAQPCAATACPDTSLIRIPIIDDNAEIEGKEQVCPGALEVYTIEPFQGTNFQWTISGGGYIAEGQGTNRVLVQWSDFASNNSYNLSVQYDNCYLGCGGQDTIEVLIRPPFVINGPVELCENSSGNFTSKLSPSGQNLDCSWTVYDPSGTVSWTGSGNSANISYSNGSGYYRIFATPTDPTLTCSTQADWAVSVPDAPTPAGGIDGNPNICPGNPLNYTATGLPFNANIRWTIQNGAGAPTQVFGNPVLINWAAAGPYGLTVEQLSNDGLNCVSDPVSISPTPFTPAAAQISGPDSTCLNGTTILSASGVDGLPLQWAIPSGAGTIIGVADRNAVEIFWNVPGLQTVELLVCGQAVLHQVEVLSDPDPIPVHPSGLCQGTNDLITLTGSFSSYSWQSESGSVLGTAASQQLGPGHYVIEVINAFGCIGNNDFTINTFPQPNVDISTTDPTGFCNNSETVTIRALTASGGAYTYQWFQDGNPVGGNTNIFTTNQYGNYTIVVTNADGCTDSAGPILVFEDCSGGGQCSGFPGHGPPVCPPGSMSFTVNATAACDSFDFSMVLGPNYVPGTANWYFGKSGGLLLGTDAGDDVGFKFPNAGGYIALVQAEHVNGSVCVLADSAFVEAAARFDTLIECAGAASQFTDISAFMPNSSISTWDWDFGDPASGPANTSISQDPNHTFDAGGLYEVRLTISAASGCTSTYTTEINIPEGTILPIIPPANSCENTSVAFEAMPGSDIIDLNWNFDDPGSGSANTASGNLVYHAFPAGMYTIDLTTTNSRGCVATSSAAFNTSPNLLSGDITPIAPAPICEGGSIVLTAPAGGVSYFWSDSLTTSNTLTASIENSYSVTLTDANGCTYSPNPVQVDINPGPAGLIKALLENDLGQVIGTAYDLLEVCEGEDVVLVAQGIGSYQYTWSNGETGNAITFRDEHGDLLSVGPHQFTVTITDPATGCTSVSTPFTVNVNPVPSGFFIQQTNSPACAGTVNTLEYNGPIQANWQYVWNNGIADTTLTTTQPGTYFIRVTNEFGCAATSNEVQVLPGPNVFALPSGCHTRCRPDTLCFPTLPGIVSWQWFQDGNPVPGATSSEFVATQSGTYWAELTDIYGCSAQSESLNLDLYDGYGDILGNVWSDVNDNGIIDGPDTLLSGIPIELLENAIQVGTDVSGTSGGFAFTNVGANSYTVAIDVPGLPMGWTVVIGSSAIDILGCDDLEQTEFLLHFSCTAAPNNIQLAACAGDSVQYNGAWLQAGTMQDFNFTTAAGCDSLVTVSVASLNPTSNTLNVSACPGTNYDYNGTLIPAGQSQDFTLTNYLGCDSLLTVQVAPLATSTGTLDVSVCPGASYDYNGTLIPEGQSQSFTLTNYLGCDSVLTVNVGPLPTSSATLNVSACPGTSYDYNGTLIPAGQSQDFTLTNYLGCDSVLTVQVAPLATSTGTLDVSVCPGTSYDYNGTMIPAGQSQDFTLTNYLGCDSVLTVQVGSYNTETSTLQVGACPGENYDYYGTLIPAGQSQDFMLQTFHGCDSVVTVDVTAFQAYADAEQVSICPGTTYEFMGQELLPGAIETFHFQTQEGCDSSITIEVLAYPDLDFEVNTGISCPNAATGSIEVQIVQGNSAPYQYSVDGGTFQSAVLFENLDGGTHTVVVQDANNCSFELDTFINSSLPLSVFLEDGILACEDPEITLTPLISGDTQDLDILWSTGDTSISTTILDAGPVWVEVSNQCEQVMEEAVVNWADLPAHGLVYVPNAFRPASNMLENHHFRAYLTDGVDLISYQFQVYDRWGNKLFETRDISTGWTGPFRAEDMQPGVFVWILEAEVQFCGRNKTIRMEGDVTLVR